MTSSPAPQTSAGILLAKQLKLMQGADGIEGISVGLVSDSSLFDWEVMLMVSDLSLNLWERFYQETCRTRICRTMLRPKRATLYCNQCSLYLLHIALNNLLTNS